MQALSWLHKLINNYIGKQMNLKEQYIESLNCALDSCYRDLDYYESIGHQSNIDEVEQRIVSLKQQIEEQTK